MSPSEKEMLKLLVLFKTISEGFTKHELHYVRSNKHLHCVSFIENNELEFYFNYNFHRFCLIMCILIRSLINYLKHRRFLVMDEYLQID